MKKREGQRRRRRKKGRKRGEKGGKGRRELKRGEREMVSRVKIWRKIMKDD